MKEEKVESSLSKRVDKQELNGKNDLEQLKVDLQEENNIIQDKDIMAKGNKRQKSRTIIGGFFEQMNNTKQNKEDKNEKNIEINRSYIVQRTQFNKLHSRRYSYEQIQLPEDIAVKISEEQLVGSKEKKQIPLDKKIKVIDYSLRQSQDYNNDLIFDKNLNQSYESKIQSVKQKQINFIDYNITNHKGTEENIINNLNSKINMDCQSLVNTIDLPNQLNLNCSQEKKQPIVKFNYFEIQDYNEPLITESININNKIPNKQEQNIYDGAEFEEVIQDIDQIPLYQHTINGHYDLAYHHQGDQKTNMQFNFEEIQQKIIVPENNIIDNIVEEEEKQIIQHNHEEIQPENNNLERNNTEQNNESESNWVDDNNGLQELNDAQQRIMNSISQLYFRLQQRIQAVRYLRNILDDMKKIKKIKSNWYFFPLTVAFIYLSIKNGLNYCNSFLFIHLCLYSLLSFRNTFISHFLYTKYSKYQQILIFYETNVLAHTQFRSILAEIQQQYRQLEPPSVQQDNHMSKENQCISPNLNNVENQQSQRDNQEEEHKSLNLDDDSVNKNKQSPEIDNQNNNDIELNNDRNLQQEEQKENSGVVQNQQVLQIQSKNDEHISEKSEHIAIDLDQQNNKDHYTLELLINYMYDKEQLKKVLIKADNIEDQQDDKYRNYIDMRIKKAGLNIGDLIITDDLVDFLQQILYVLSLSQVKNEIERKIQYGGQYRIIPILVNIYNYLEQSYFLIINTMQISTQFCYSSEFNIVFSFSVLFSIQSWIQIIILTFSIIFMVLALVFFFFFQIFSQFKKTYTVLTIPFKTAKAQLIASKKFTEADLADASCIICYEEFKDKDSVFLSRCCNRCFHKLCITEWTKKSRNCPLCRQSFPLE